MISLQPREQFQIVRQLGDHTDGNTYFVRAVVRDSVTDTILKTQNLTMDATDIRRFKANYEVPADVSGLGFYIDITTSVYSDSGYTTKASTYSDELESYLVFDRIMKTGGGGGGVDVDYKKIQKMLDALVKKFPEIKETDFSVIFNTLTDIKAEIKAIDIPEMPEIPKLELSPVLDAISKSEKAIVNAIDNKEVTESTDLSPVVEEIRANDVNITALMDKVSEVSDTLDGYIQKEEYEKQTEEDSSKKKLEKIAEVIAPILSGTEVEKEEMPEPIDPLLARTKKLL